MMERFCSQCGKQVPAGYSFCSSCGTVQIATGLVPPQTHQQPVQFGQQTYQQPYQAGQQSVYSAPRVTTAKATGLIVGVFALVAAFILAVFVFILPSKEDFALLSLEGTPQSYVTESPGQEQAQDSPVFHSAAYGEPPEAVLAKVNTSATVEDYSGSYRGTVYFKSENLDIMTELTGDSAYEEIIANYNGKSYQCTAEIDDCISAFSPDVYSENEDGSFYTYYYYDMDLENGIAIEEERDADEEVGLDYYIADKAYFLTDGSVYVITIVTAEFDDGRSLASEIRIELTPIT